MKESTATSGNLIVALSLFLLVSQAYAAAHLQYMGGMFKPEGMSMQVYGMLAHNIYFMAGAFVAGTNAILHTRMFWHWKGAKRARLRKVRVRLARVVFATFFLSIIILVSEPVQQDFPVYQQIKVSTIIFIAICIGLQAWLDRMEKISGP